MDASVDALALVKAEEAYKEQMERKVNLDSAVKSWRPAYQHNSVFSSLRPKGPGSDVSKPSSKSSTRTMSRKREALALAQLKIRQLKARQRLDEEEREIRKKRELFEAEIEAEKAEVSLRIYEEEIGDERRDTELVICHDEEYWHPPKSQGVADPRGTLEPLTVDHTSPLKPEVPAIPPLSTINYLNETVSGSFTPHSKRDTPVVPAVLHNSAQPNGYATLQSVSRPSNDRQLRFTPSLDNPTFGTVGAVTSSVTSTSTTVTSSSVVPEVQPRELRRTTAYLLSRDSAPLFVDSVISSMNSSQTLYRQPVRESWSSAWQMPRTQTSQNVRFCTTPVQHYDSGKEMVKALRQVVTSPKVEYLKFDGDPLRYVTFIHNFETYLEQDNPDDSRRLQLLIQHCTGKAREAIESCANLPVSDGYRVAKETLRGILESRI